LDTSANSGERGKGGSKSSHSTQILDSDGPADSLKIWEDSLKIGEKAVTSKINISSHVLNVVHERHQCCQVRSAIDIQISKQSAVLMEDAKVLMRLNDFRQRSLVGVVGEFLDQVKCVDSSGIVGGGELVGCDVIGERGVKCHGSIRLCHVHSSNIGSQSTSGLKLGNLRL